MLIRRQTLLLRTIGPVTAGLLFTTGLQAVTLEETRRYIEINDLHWTAGETSVSWMTDAEFHELLKLKVPEGYFEPPEELYPETGLFEGRASFDWRDHNGVTAVKDQEDCGSCWAFATTAMVESFIYIYDGNNWDLSEQQLISCNNLGYGCNGGWFYPQHYQNPGGIFESCMPYEASDSVPCTEGQCQKVAFIDGYEEISSSVNSIKNALADGPVAVAMYAYSDLRYYTGGCYSHGSSSSVNHGVLIVGYDDADCSGQGGWIVKNSWGSSWGDDGFFRIKYGDCNIGYGATRIYYTPNVSVELVFVSRTIDDSAGGNGDGQVDPGETVLIPVVLGNTGTTTGTSVAAFMTSSHYGVTVNDNLATYPDIPGGQQRESVSPHYSVTFDSQLPEGSVAMFSLAISCDQGSFSGSFYVPVGDIPLPTATPVIPTGTPVPTNSAIPTYTPLPTQHTNTPLPTWTGQPTFTPAPPGTNTPVPTFTCPPPPTPTPDGPLPTATPYPTGTPYPTYTPSDPEPSPTPQDTHGPDKIHIELNLNQPVYRFNDPFELNLIADNPGSARMTEQYLIFEVNGSFWFWPSWSAGPDSTVVIYPAGRTEKHLLNFAWPDVGGRMSGLAFHALLCNPGTFDTISNFSTVTFAYE
ncbi:hypothetical protein JXA40_06875 [bacterium]|nr:hypothetical protein [candidate division CSSED10-310 bacterium]